TAVGGGTAATPAAGASTFQGTIEFWDWAHDPRVALMERLVSEWEQTHAGVDLKYNPLDWTEIETKILTAASAGSGPAFSNVHYFWRFEMQRSGVLAPYPDDLFNWSQLISTPYNRDPETGKIYTSDFNWYADELFFNRELLEAEGIAEDTIPRNWDDFIRLAQQLTKTDGSGKITQVGFSLNDYWAREWLWMDLIYQQGGWLWSEDGSEAIWNSEEGVRALQFIRDVYHTWKVDDPEFLPQGEAFGNGQAATYVNMGYTAAGINSEYPQMEGKWSTMVEPTYSGEPLPSWGLQVPEEGFAVFAKFPDDVKAMAFDFIKFALGSDDRRIEWALVMDGPPDVIPLLDAPPIEERVTIAAQAETLPYRIFYGERPLEAEQLWRTMFDQVVLEGADPKAVLDDMTAQMNATLKETGKRRIIVERNYQPPAA
ncbi:MAG TPA: extracellular solute-binding protein, partial [Ardenticatenaceae bacterium]|nr:extracellular solute-binding protein [Ardenticatenaceae bacterium]